MLVNEEFIKTPTFAFVVEKTSYKRIILACHQKRVPKDTIQNLRPKLQEAFLHLVTYVEGKEDKVWKLIHDKIDSTEFGALDHSELIIGARLGNGAFGTVHEGTYNGMPVAIKIDPNTTHHPIYEFRREVNTLMYSPIYTVSLIFSGHWITQMLQSALDIQKRQTELYIL